MAYWILWKEAISGKGHRRGPFHNYQDAVRRIEEDLREWSA